MSANKCDHQRVLVYYDELTCAQMMIMRIVSTITKVEFKLHPSGE